MRCAWSTRRAGFSRGVGIATRRRGSGHCARGPQAGLDLLSPLLHDRALKGYQPLHAAHAELLKRAGEREGAARAYETAIELSANAVERAELERRLLDL